MRRILVTGSRGQLGSALRAELAGRQDLETLFTNRDSLDVTSAEAVRQVMDSFRPELVVNCAAYTAVDRAESDKEACRMLNTEAPRILAENAACTGARLIHISTDYVFDGLGTRPYRESDMPGPGTVYGQTKLEGEEAVRRILPQGHVILRTAWLYSLTGHNFVKTMLSLAAERDEIGVVADQWGSPTYAPVLARAVAAVMDAARWMPGTYHATCAGRTTWYDFTRAILAEAGVTRCRVRPLTSDEYPTPARRPHYSVLDCSRFQNAYRFPLPDWQTSLHDFFNDFKA